MMIPVSTGGGKNGFIDVRENKAGDSNRQGISNAPVARRAAALRSDGRRIERPLEFSCALALPRLRWTYVARYAAMGKGDRGALAFGRGVGQKDWCDMNLGPSKRMAIVAAGVLLFDQLTKLAVLKYLGYAQEKVIIEGFFKFVHWRNTGAAWSLFNQFAGSNQLLAIFALVALLVLFLTRHHFDSHTLLGQLSLGLIFGGIAGNLMDRFNHGHVVDFIYFYLNRRGGGEIGFPAFNVADSAICTGVGLLFLLSWQKDHAGAAPTKEPAGQN